MVSLMHTLALLGCSPMRVSISIRKALKVVITLREDFYNNVEIVLQAISQSALLMNLRDEKVLSSSTLPRIVVMAISASRMNSLSFESNRLLHPSFCHSFVTGF
jgi:hypothetical protein